MGHKALAGPFGCASGRTWVLLFERNLGTLADLATGICWVQTSNWFPESAPSLTHYTPTPLNRRSLLRQALRSNPLSRTTPITFRFLSRGVYI